jgi:hypothetical protein
MAILLRHGVASAWVVYGWRAKGDAWYCYCIRDREEECEGGKDRFRRKQTGRIGRWIGGVCDNNVWYRLEVVTEDLRLQGLACMQDTLTS